MARAILLLSLFVSSIAFAAPASPIPVKENVTGVSQPDLTKRWWVWFFSFEPGQSPTADRTGAKCAERQDGPIWFLVGVTGGGSVKRTCHLPEGKTLFFPLVTYIFVPNGAGSCTEMILQARESTDGAKLFAELDGEPIGELEKHRVTSGNCFDAGEKSPGHMSLWPAASNGYWLALPPLSKGQHKLHYGGTVPTLNQDVTYTLIVE